MFSAFYERAAVNVIDDLRGLGIVTNKHFFKSERSAEFVKNRLLVQEGIACRFTKALFLRGVNNYKYFQSRPCSAFHFVMIRSISLVVSSSLFLILSMTSLLRICSSVSEGLSIISKT